MDTSVHSACDVQVARAILRVSVASTFRDAGFEQVVRASLETCAAPRNSASLLHTHVGGAAAAAAGQGGVRPGWGDRRGRCAPLCFCCSECGPHSVERGLCVAVLKPRRQTRGVIDGLRGCGGREKQRDRDREIEEGGERWGEGALTHTLPAECSFFYVQRRGTVRPRKNRAVVVKPKLLGDPATSADGAAANAAGAAQGGVAGTGSSADASAAEPAAAAAMSTDTDGAAGDAGPGSSAPAGSAAKQGRREDADPGTAAADSEARPAKRPRSDSDEGGSAGEEVDADESEDEDEDEEICPITVRRC